MAKKLSVVLLHSRSLDALAAFILLFPADHDYYNFFATSRVMYMYSMPRVCFKPIMWHIEIHHVRAFFLCGVMTFLLCDVHSQVYLYNCKHGCCLSAEDNIQSRKIWCVFLVTKCLISFPLDDKHVVNEQHVVKKVVTPQKKCPHMVHFNVPCDWFVRWPTTVTAIINTSRQNQKCHGEIKFPTAKPKCSRQ